jgi:hypothetical protein
MPTLVFDPPPAELEALLERRRDWGADRHDEVWEGVLHVIPLASVEHGRLFVELARLLGRLADAAELELTGGIGIGAGPGPSSSPNGWTGEPRVKFEAGPPEGRPHLSSRSRRAGPGARHVGRAAV